MKYTPNNKMIKNITTCLIITFMAIVNITYSQEKVIDQTIAVVGNNAIKLSELESQYNQYILQGYSQGDYLRCLILEELLFQKLLIYTAKLDSVKISESQVESELDRRIRYFVNQIGSEEKLEQYYNKKIDEIKIEFREAIKNQLLAQSVEAKITQEIKITPSEVRAFYNNIDKDSVPLVNSEFEIQQIIKYPPINESERKVVKDKLNGLRERIKKGEEFSTLAILYSEDPLTAKKGGELGFLKRGEMKPELEAVAFNLKGNEVSEVIEGKDGFFIVQLIERRGEQINIRHILIKRKPSPIDLMKTKSKLDSISDLINKKQFSFSDAVNKFSDDLTKNNGGFINNPKTGNTKFESNDIDPSIYFVIDKMKVGDMSKPILFNNEEGVQGYRILYLKSHSEPHKANLKDDYSKIQAAALEAKKTRTLSEWVIKKKQTAFIRINDEYKVCKFKHKWF